MNDPERTDPSPPQSNMTAPDSAKLHTNDSKESAASGDAAEPGKLTPEEQMELYEKQLKEDDWGHQPC